MPKTAEAQEILQLKLSQLLSSPTQPRQSFPEESLQELARSIKAQGVLQPLLVRAAEPQGQGCWEVVDGERRWKAAELAGLTWVPCLVGRWTDQEVIEIQVVQAIQREGLAPMDEARAYKRLLDLGLHWDDVAAKAGKSKSYIYHRTRLLDLAPEVQDALALGTLKLALAEQFVRVPDHKQQVRLLKEADRCSNVSQLNDVIESRFLLQLASAPFDIKDPGLSPRGGACGDCSRRTGAQADLLGDVDGADSCLDPECWNDKAVAAKTALEAKAEERGLTVLQGKDAKRALKALGSYYGPKDFAEAGERPSWLKEGTLGEAAKVAGVKAVGVFDPNQGKVRKVFDVAAVKAGVPANLRHKEQAEEKEPSKQDLEKREQLRKIQQLADQLGTAYLLDAVRKAVETTTSTEYLRDLAVGVMENAYGDFKPLATALGQGKLDLKKAKASPLAVLVLATLAVSDQDLSREPWAPVLKALKVDPKPVLAKAEAEALKALQPPTAAKEGEGKAGAEKASKGKAVKAGGKKKAAKKARK